MMVRSHLNSSLKNRYLWRGAISAFASVVVFAPIDVGAKPLAQMIYEDLNGRKCGEAGFKEIEGLKCRGNLKKFSFSDLDDTSEALVFSDIGNREVERLQCLETEITRIVDSPDVKADALERTCENLKLLKNFVDDENHYKTHIERNESLNDRWTRIVPNAEFDRRKQVIAELKNYLALTQENIRILRENDALLGSPQVFDSVVDQMRPGFLGNGPSAERACTFLKGNLNRLLTSQRNFHRQDLNLIRSKLESPAELVKDDSLKRKLWMSASRNDFVSSLGDSFDFTGSTICRMEGRYGEGAVLRDKLTMIGSLALGFGAPSIGRVAGWVYRQRIAAAVYAERANIVYNAARTATVVEIAVGASVVSPSVIDACFKEHLQATGGKKACEAKSDSEFKNLFYQKQNFHRCAVVGGAGAVFAGFAALSARGVFKAMGATDLNEDALSRLTQSRVLYEQTKNELKVTTSNVPLRPPTLPSSAAIGFQGEQRTKALLEGAEASKLPGAQILRETEVVMQVARNNTRNRLFLFGLSPERLRKLHGQLMSDEPAYRASFLKSKYQREKDVLLRDGEQEYLENLFIRTIKDGLNESKVDPLKYFSKGGESKDIINFRSLYSTNQEFKIWYYNQSMSVPEATKDLDAYVQKILKRWEEEVARRYQPKSALKGSEYVNSNVESQAKVAYFGDRQFIASADGKVWIASQADGIPTRIIPRWRGNDRDKFLEELGRSKDPRWQQQMAEKYAKEPVTPVEQPIPVALPEASPTTEGGVVYQKGAFFNSFERGRAEPLIRYAVENHSWGYHIAPFDRLQGIIDKGWLTSQARPSGMGSGTPALHMSTHLRVNYSIGDQSQVILRTPLRPGLDKAGFRGDEGAEVMFHGHVYRTSGIEKDQVSQAIEFSVDNGVSWYPMTQEFVTAAKQGLLPNFRAVQAPNSP